MPILGVVTSVGGGAVSDSTASSSAVTFGSASPGAVPTNNIRDPTTRIPVAIATAMTAPYRFSGGGGGGGDGGTGGNDMRVSESSTANPSCATSPKASACVASCLSHAPSDASR